MTNKFQTYVDSIQSKSKLKLLLVPILVTILIIVLNQLLIIPFIFIFININNISKRFGNKLSQRVKFSKLLAKSFLKSN